MLACMHAFIRVLLVRICIIYIDKFKIIHFICHLLVIYFVIFFALRNRCFLY